MGVGYSEEVDNWLIIINIFYEIIIFNVLMYLWYYVYCRGVVRFKLFYFFLMMNIVVGFDI